MITCINDNIKLLEDLIILYLVISRLAYPIADTEVTVNISWAVGRDASHID